MIKNSKFGFTLIELLVVISIIGILASLLLARFGTVEKSGRDTKRKSDLNQYRTALENYAIKTNGTYPSYTTAAGVQVTIAVCRTPVLLPDYIASCPEDPRYDEYPPYLYQSNGSGTWCGITCSATNDATQYVLWAKTETGRGYWVVCSNGKVGEAQSVNITNGSCPL